MRIALVIGNYDAHGGGAERWTDGHARMLLRDGHEVHLVARRFRGAPDEAVCHAIDTGRTQSRRRLQFARRAEALLCTLDVDVVHDMGDGWYCDILMPHHGTRLGIFLHNTRHQPNIVQAARRWAYRWVPRYREFQALERRQYEAHVPRLFVAVSNMIRDHMQGLYGVPGGSIRVVYNGVDVQRFRPAEEDGMRWRVRRDLGVSDAETLFLCVAHNFRLKGVDTILRALSTMRAEGRARQAGDRSGGEGGPARLVVVGDGPVSRYQALAASLGCGDAVRFVGDQPDPRRYYEAADVFVLPTYYDPCSLVVLEAMACGLPVITSTLNGVHELMSVEGDGDGVGAAEAGVPRAAEGAGGAMQGAGSVMAREGAVIRDPGDEVQLTAAMRPFLNETVRRGAAAAARQLAERQSARAMYERHLRVYEEVVAAKREAAASSASVVHGIVQQR